jgi:hypothetical protein
MLVVKKSQGGIDGDIVTWRQARSPRSQAMVLVHLKINQVHLYISFINDIIEIIDAY